MPAVVVGVAAGAAAGAAGYALTTAVVVGLAAGVVAQVTFNQMELPKTAEGFDEQSLTTSPAQPRRGIYGESVVSGPIVGYGKSRQNKADFHHLIIPLAAHRCHSVTLYQVEDKTEEQIPSSHIISHAYLGDQTKVDASAKQTIGGWTDKHVGFGQTYARLIMKIDSEVFPNGLTHIKYKVRGQAVYDPRLDSTVPGGSGPQRADDESTWAWSNNPILISLHHTRFRGFRPVPLRRFVMSNIIDEANLCDEQVTFTSAAGKTTTEKRYVCNGTWGFDEAPPSVLKRILATCGGKVIRSGGQMLFKAAAYRGPAAIALTAGDATAKIKYRPHTPVRERCNFVRGSFIDPAKDYQQTDLTPVSSETYKQQDGTRLEDDIRLPMVQSDTQGQRLLRLHLERNRAGFVLDFPAKASLGLQLMPGSVVKVRIPEDGIDKEFEVDDWKFDYSKKSVGLTLKETATGIYSDAVVPAERDLTPNTSFDPTVITAPSGLRVLVSSVGRALVWEHDSPDAVDRYLVTVTRGDKTIIQQATSTAELVLPPLDAGDYVVAVRAQNSFKRLSDAAAMQFNVSLPGRPTVRIASVSESGVTLSASVDNAGLSTTFEWQFLGPVASPITGSIVRAGNYAYTGLASATLYAFQCRTVNAAGHSAWRTVQVTTRSAQTVFDEQGVKINLDHLESDVAAAIKRAGNLSLNLGDNNALLRSIQTELERNSIEDIEALAEQGLAEHHQITTEHRVGKALAKVEQNQTAIANEREARAQLKTDIDAEFKSTKASFTQQIDTVANAQQAMVSQVTLMQVALNGVQANYASRSYVNASVNAAEAGVLRTIDARFDENTGAYGIRIKAAADAASAAASKAQALSAGIYDAQGNFSQAFVDKVALVTVEANGETIASAVSNYSVTAGGKTYTLQTLANASVDANGNNFAAQWGVQTSLDGIKHGAGFYVKDGKTFFVVSVNNFVIHDPSTNAITSMPFFIENGVVFIDTARIKSLSVNKLDGDVVDIRSRAINELLFPGSGNNTSEQTVYEFRIAPQPFARVVEISPLPIEWGSLASIFYSVYDVSGGPQIKLGGNGQINKGWSPSLLTFDVPAGQTKTFRGRIRAMHSTGTAIVRGNISVKLYKKGDGITFLH